MTKIDGAISQSQNWDKIAGSPFFIFQNKPQHNKMQGRPMGRPRMMDMILGRNLTTRPG
jgi:hypothetical protein